MYTSERDFSHGTLDVAGSAALLGRVLHRSHSICSVVFDLAIRSVNNKLASLFRFNAFPRSLDRLALSDENLSRFAFRLYDPSAVGRKYMNGLCSHVRIVPLTAKSDLC